MLLSSLLGPALGVALAAGVRASARRSVVGVLRFAPMPSSSLWAAAARLEVMALAKIAPP